MSSAQADLLRCMQNCSAIASVIPVPGLGIALSTVVLILETVESVKVLKRNCRSLAEKAAGLVIAIHIELLETEGTIPETLQTHVAPLLQVLGDIQMLASSLSRTSWIQYLWSRSRLQSQIADNQLRLADSSKAFQIRALLRVQILLAKMEQKQTREVQAILDGLVLARQAAEENTRKRHAELINQTQAIAAAVSSSKIEIQRGHEQNHVILTQVQKMIESNLEAEDSEICIIRRGVDLTTIKEFLPQDHENGAIYHGDYKGHRVLIKRYLPGEAGGKRFQRDLTAWKALWHPNFPQLIGRSSHSADHPHLVLSGLALGSIPSYLQSTLSKDRTESFMKTLEVMQGIVSALDYLRLTCRMTKGLIEKCSEVSNILMGSGGQAIIGKDLIKEAPSLETTGIRDNRWEALCYDRLWFLMRNCVIGDHDITRWSYAGGFHQKSHLRPFMALVSFVPDNTMTRVSSNIGRLYDNLSEIQQNYGKVTITDIRQGLLSLEGSIHNFYSFMPSTPWDVNPGDVGYVKDGAFFRLCNFLELSTLQVDYAPELATRCDPGPCNVRSEIISDDYIRHTYTAAIYAGFRRSYQAIIQDTRSAMNLFLQHARSLVEKHGELHNFRLHDLIFVTGRVDTQVGATFRWADDVIPAVKEVYLFEYVGASQPPSAYWSLDGTFKDLRTDLAAVGAVASSYCYRQQRIAFLQLEEGEV